MDFDIKYIILWGGGVLLALVLLHGLWLSWRSRRDAAAPSQQEPEPLQPAEQADLPLAMSAEAAENGALEAGAQREPERIVIPGRRTEPTVPLAVRMAEQQRPEDAPSSGLSDVVVIWVVAKSGATMDGQTLLDAFAATGLEYDGEVFHKLDANTRSELFQVANGVEPGTFDLADVEALSTPRVAMLLRFSDRIDPSHAFEEMIQSAQDIADALDADMKDERMSDMSIQTIEHCRQRIRDYKRMSIRA